MKYLKGLLVMILWSVCFLMTTVFLVIEYLLSLIKFKSTGKKSTRYFQSRPIFPSEED